MESEDKIVSVIISALWAIKKGLNKELPWPIFILLQLRFHVPANNYNILLLSFLVQPSIYDFPCRVICTSQYTANELYFDISATAFPYQRIFLVTFYAIFFNYSLADLAIHQCQSNSFQLLSQTVHSPISFLSSIKLLYQLIYMNILWFWQEWEETAKQERMKSIYLKKKKNPYSRIN